MSYGVQIEGVDDLLKRLDAVGDTKTLRDGMTSVAVSLTTKLKQYPPAPANSSYQRTGTLRHRWTYAVDDDGSDAVIGNFTPYAPLVQGRESQTWFHKRTGWQTAENLLDGKKEDIVKVLRQFIQKALDGRG
jgi:hypothetical protein